mmetsp:Transcript_12466/g.10553  ORF Transcript_12466/g.10553 Transcript_12466/m.10553 type:complete len:98 (-) Transcript_12466:17-310(-)
MLLFYVFLRISDVQSNTRPVCYTICSKVLACIAIDCTACRILCRPMYAEACAAHGGVCFGFLVLVRLKQFLQCMDMCGDITGVLLQFFQCALLLIEG